MNTTTNEALLKKIDEAPLLMSKEAAKKKLRKPRSIYGDQILFMLAITVIATCFYGMRVVTVCACSVLACILTDMVGCFLSKKEYGVKDLSTIAYGMALALMLPASVEYYVVIIGAVLAITVKHIFGGKDNYIFNPAAVAIAFLIICYPTQVLMYPQYLVIRDFGLLDTLGAVIFPAVFSTFPVFLLHRFFLAIPGEILEAARIDGAGELRIFWQVGIPLGKPGIMAVGILSFLDSWNLIEQPMTYLKTKSLWPLSLFLPQIQLKDIGMGFAAALLMLIPALLLFISGQEYLEQGIALSGGKD